MLGEYERTATTAVNAYVAPKVVGYLDDLERRLREEGLRDPLLVMQASGGLTSVEDAARRPILTLDSGPTGGILGCQYLGRLYGEENVICTDVGGTSFDVGLILRGEVPLDPEPVVSQYVMRIPKVSVQSIGAGGGSHRLARRGRPAARRPAERGLAAGARVLRPRRDRADGDRRRPRARLPRPGRVPRRADGARPRPRARGARAARRAARDGARGGRDRGLPDHQRPHGRPHPQVDDRAGPRPARVRPRRLRRRRADARRLLRPRHRLEGDPRPRRLDRVLGRGHAHLRHHPHRAGVAPADDARSPPRTSPR